MVGPSSFLLAPLTTAEGLIRRIIVQIAITRAVVSWQLMGDKIGDVALGQLYQQLVSRDLSCSSGII